MRPLSGSRVSIYVKHGGVAPRLGCRHDFDGIGATRQSMSLKKLLDFFKFRYVQTLRF